MSTTNSAYEQIQKQISAPSWFDALQRGAGRKVMPMHKLISTDGIPSGENARRVITKYCPSIEMNMRGLSRRSRSNLALFCHETDAFLRARFWKFRGSHRRCEVFYDLKRPQADVTCIGRQVSD